MKHDKLCTTLAIDIIFFKCTCIVYVGVGYVDLKDLRDVVGHTAEERFHILEKYDKLSKMGKFKILSAFVMA